MVIIQVLFNTLHQIQHIVLGNHTSFIQYITSDSKQHNNILIVFIIEFLLYVDCAKTQDEQSLKKMAESRAALYYEIKEMNKINSAQSSPMELPFITYGKRFKFAFVNH